MIIAAVCDFSLSSCLKPHHIGASSDCCIVNYCSHNCTLLPSAPCIALHCLSCDCGEHRNLNENNYAEWETDKLEQNLKLVLHIRHEHQLLCMNGNTLKQKNLTSRIKVRVRVRVRGPICLDFLRC